MLWTKIVLFVEIWLGHPPPPHTHTETCQQLTQKVMDVVFNFESYLWHEEQIKLFLESQGMCNTCASADRE